MVAAVIVAAQKQSGYMRCYMLQIGESATHVTMLCCITVHTFRVCTVLFIVYDSNSCFIYKVPFSYLATLALCTRHAAEIIYCKVPTHVCYNHL